MITKATPDRPHDHGQQQTGAPTPTLDAAERERQQCARMMADMRAAPHDHGRDKTGAPTPRPSHDPANPSHQRCMELMGQDRQQ